LSVVTIHDIAKEAQVSISTVSRVINNTKEVSPELKKRVYNIIKNHNYEPNQIARSLVTRKTGMIGIILSNISNAVFGALTRGIESICRSRDYTLIVCESGGKNENETKLLQTLGKRHIDGLLFAGVEINQALINKIQSQDYPTVLVTQEISMGVSQKPLPVVIHDNFQAVKDAIHFLYDNNHRKIAFIMGLKNDFSSGQRRFAGYMEALKELGLEYRESYVAFGDFTFESGYKCIRKIYEENTVLPTAVMACSDLIAIGAMRCLENLNIKVPDAMSVMGFDDIELASYVNPELSTVRISYFDEGVYAAETLFSLMEHRELSPPSTFYLPHQIIRRKSVRNMGVTG
jgi:LacI family transcriptional regulator